MTLQKQLNNNTINRLDKILSIIKHSEDFEANQIYNYALRAVLTNRKAIIDMNERQLDAFQDTIIEAIQFKGWYIHPANTPHLY